MSKTVSNKKVIGKNLGWACLAGVSVFLAFPKFWVIPLILFFPALFNRLCERAKTPWQAFWYGYVTSFVVLLGGFYWVTYVIHEFGNLNWFISGFIFLGFCIIGAVNFPVAAAAYKILYSRLKIESRGSPFFELWYLLIVPAIFSLAELMIPKLFPWYIGHCLYLAPWVTQIAEITGSIGLSFLIYSVGGIASLAFSRRAVRWRLVSIPVGLLTFSILFSVMRLAEGLPSKTMKVALVQANIGNMDKILSRNGHSDRVQYVVDAYTRLTRNAIAEAGHLDLILWPETAMPFELEIERKPKPREVRQFVLEVGTPLITGAYSVSPFDVTRTFNSAFLLEPLTTTMLRQDLYHKNILLAFGEYMPLGEMFPSLYQKFPEVSNFERGKSQNAFSLKDGTRIGVTICYEAIVPSFFRKVVANEVNLIVNLTNDSWFGPTSEPYLHGELATFRSIESRVPLLRVTNTGISFAVDILGRMSRHTPVMEESALVETIHVPTVPGQTIYTHFGDWIAIVFAGMLVLYVLLLSRRKDAPLPARVHP